ncbi:hypothetical protein GWG65_34395 [Bradyrhizobium sp. CSA207]|uniref:hypothetical protein n=1 Tax=Bradyrhizobium sp. CSA207 TaxID=2698826 RepID=UPI0023AED0F1|nr:hypothetical protein [Bradyrhizobium sp. CSA207]MDE5446365.1 hypothetical protein [Bradyrhizobium sp. CSA207]
MSWLTNQRALWGKPVLFVSGNHECYGSVLQDAAAKIRDAARGTNVTFLDADAVPVIDGVRFLGCTLWTDYRFEARNQVAGLFEPVGFQRWSDGAFRGEIVSSGRRLRRNEQTG